MASLHLARLLAVLQSLLFFQVPLSHAIIAPTANLGYAQYQGAIDTVTNTTSFLGIRFAAAPVGMRNVMLRAFHGGLISLNPGNLRWAAPKPPQTLSSVQDATTQPNACNGALNGNSPTDPFSTVFKRAVSVSEDCLFLRCVFCCQVRSRNL